MFRSLHSIYILSGIPQECQNQVRGCDITVAPALVRNSNIEIRLAGLSGCPQLISKSELLSVFKINYVNLRG